MPAEQPSQEPANPLVNDHDPKQCWHCRRNIRLIMEAAEKVPERERYLIRMELLPLPAK